MRFSPCTLSDHDLGIIALFEIDGHDKERVPERLKAFFESLWQVDVCQEWLLCVGADEELGELLIKEQVGFYHLRPRLRPARVLSSLLRMALLQCCARACVDYISKL